LSYDGFHKNGQNIYRVHRYFYDENGSENLHLPNVAAVIAPLLQQDFSAIQQIARVYHSGMVFSSGNYKMQENNICFAEPAVLKIFTFEGLPVDSNLLTRPLTAIISEETADKYFPQQDAIGKTLAFNDENGGKHALEISGVFKQWKQPAHFNPDFLVSFSTLEAAVGEDELKDWSSNNYETFALIPYLPADIDNKLDVFIDKHLDNGTKWTKIRLERLTDIHFNWYSSRSYIYILTSIALLILVLGSINFMNLNAAMYSKKLKDITIRRIIGASQKRLIVQLLAESVLFCFIALIIALYIASITLPVFNAFFINSFDFKFTENLLLVAGFVALSVLTGILSGIYPLAVLSSKRPGTANNANIHKGKTTFRNGLVVFQFVVSIVLIISFLLVSKQLNYLHHKALGIDKENIVVIPATPLLLQKFDVFKQQLTKNPNVLSVSGSKRVPSSGLFDSNGARVISGGNAIPLGFRLANIRTDDQFIPTYKVQLVAGRNFNENIASDFGYLINEMAVKEIGWKSPEEAVGQVIEYGGRNGSVIGVVKDFHYESLHNPISPVIIFYDLSSFDLVSVRIASTGIKNTLAFIEKTWQTYNVADNTFYYEFLNDRYNNLYRSEENIRTLFVYCMIIAISIAILGLVGLSVFLTERRTKEIGIRKVNGATRLQVMVMLNRNFIKWVLIAFVIASPIAWYAMHAWLKKFAFKTELSWWVFAAAGAVAVAVAAITVSVQSYRAATRNPVEALRYE
jgi:putative ABC transport system permease protein